MKVAKMFFWGFVSLVLFFCSVQSFAGVTIGGPYTADEHTVLLLHFDGDLTNESQLAKNGVGHSVSGSLSYEASVTGLNQCLRLDNNAQSDSSCVTVADTSYLDLTDDWTIEGWVKVATIGEAWMTDPRLVIKAGDAAFWLPNYYVNLSGSSKWFLSGYNVDGQYLWPEVSSAENILTTGDWFHVTYIRDTSKNLQIQLLHNASGELVDFAYQQYDATEEASPRLSNQPVYIGYGGGGTDSWLDGWVDEIRISNVVRDFSMPPILLNVTQLDNQSATVTSYEVVCEVYSSNMSTGSVTLRYDAGDGFQSLIMTSADGKVYSATIPRQAPGKIVKYYVKAVDSDSKVSTSPANAETNATYHQFGVFSAKDMVLSLNFEEGTGVPIDGSVYENTVEVVGTPTFSNDAASGNKSIYLDGSSYLKVDSPWLTSEEFAIDFWFKADEVTENVRLIQRPSDPWWIQNYQVKFGTNKITAGSYIPDEGRWLSNELWLDATVNAGTWYRVIYEVKKAAEFDSVNYYAALQLRDNSDNVIETKRLGFMGTVLQAELPLEIGHGGDGLHFKGYIDDLKIFNYPAVGIVVIPTETIGGPYVADEHTVLLLHFDDNLENASDLAADGVGHGSLSYISNNISGLGKCLRIDNDSQNDSSFVTVADTSTLDLTQDWTIEGWINIFTFGETSTDWRWVPRLINKTGESAFYFGNYYIEMWGDSRIFKCGYNVESPLDWIEVDSPTGAMVPGQWAHITFIRDSERNLLIQMVHNANRELTFFGITKYDPITQDPPRLNNNPVYIGFAGGGTDSWLDGFVDEVRISNIVREFDVPPIITDVTNVANQDVSAEGYTVSANIFTLFSSMITTATLHYSVNGTWYETPMVQGLGDEYTATISQQPVGSVIKYYIEAIDNAGLSATQPATAVSDSEYYSFGVYQANTQTLSLSFEEGSGTPVDNSSYGHTVTMIGTPVFSDNAKVGSHSIYLEGESSYLKIDSPFLTSEELAVEFWFNADTVKNNVRLLQRPGSPWYMPNYQVRFGSGSTITAGSYVPDEGRWLSNELYLTATVAAGKWYHVQYEVAKATGEGAGYYAVFQLLDENDQLIEKISATFTSPIYQATQPLEIGHGGDGLCYKGYIDDVHIYNYAALNLVPSGVRDKSTVPDHYELVQNYPNPFNPITKIAYSVPSYGRVKITVLNLLGEKVSTLMDESVLPGRYSVIWNGCDNHGRMVSTGIYFYVMEAKGFRQVKKMVLMK